MSTVGASCAPDLEGFLAEAAEHRIVTVSVELVADTLTPVSVFMSAVGDEEGFLLESVEGGERWGRYSFVGRRPLLVFSSVDGEVLTLGHRGPDTPVLSVQDGASGILTALEHLLAETTVSTIGDLPPLHSGVVGYLGYDVVREVEHLVSPPVDELGVPDACCCVIGELVAFDHWRQRVTLIVNVAVDPTASHEVLTRAYGDAVRRLEQLGEDATAVRTPGARLAPSVGARHERAPATRRTSAASFRGAVEVAKEHITAGDIFQVVLSQRFDIDGEVDPFGVYRSLRLLNPSPYLYFLRLGGVQVVGSSPEPMVRVRDRMVTSRPIAGTRPRGSTEAEDDRLAGDLAEDPKEVAEHIMLVDLARNDVGRVAEYGSEVVEEFMTIEHYSHVMHMTSQVTGRMRDDCTSVDVLRATLPAGTLSGAPKVRAMEIIDDLEPARRGVYGGVVGYLDFSGNVDTAIAIRTMVVTPDGRASVQAGAGVVADSDPASEDEECVNKASAVLAAVADSRRADLR